MKPDKKIIFTTVKNISPKDKEKLCKHGFLVIEVERLSELKYSQDIENDLMRESAMIALTKSYDTNAQADFLKRMSAKLFKP